MCTIFDVIEHPKSKYKLRDSLYQYNPKIDRVYREEIVAGKRKIIELTLTESLKLDGAKFIDCGELNYYEVSLGTASARPYIKVLETFREFKPGEVVEISRLKGTSCYAKIIRRTIKPKGVSRICKLAIE